MSNSTARFWTDNNGSPVKVTLRDGQPMTHSRFSIHDEGWSRETVTFTLASGIVVQDWMMDGTDCDGRLTRTGRAVCPVANLSKGWTEDGVTYPDWQSVSNRQRDYSAEAMGY
jgi:hypothetical protein